MVTCTLTYAHLYIHTAHVTCVSACFCVVLPSMRTSSDGFCGAEHLNLLAQSLRPAEVGQSGHHPKTLTHTLPCFLFLPSPCTFPPLQNPFIDN